MSFRALGFNVWRDRVEALGGITDPFHFSRAVGAVVVLGPNRGFGAAVMPRRHDPAVFVFIGDTFVGIDRYPEES